MTNFSVPPPPPTDIPSFILSSTVEDVLENQDLINESIESITRIVKMLDPKRQVPEKSKLDNVIYLARDIQVEIDRGLAYFILLETSNDLGDYSMKEYFTWINESVLGKFENTIILNEPQLYMDKVKIYLSFVRDSIFQKTKVLKIITHCNNLVQEAAQQKED
jgi:hypothetical protein